MENTKKIVQEELIKKLIFTPDSEAKEIFRVHKDLSQQINRDLKYLDTHSLIKKLIKKTKLDSEDIEDLSWSELWMDYLRGQTFEHFLKDKKLYLLVYSDNSQTELSAILHMNFETLENAYKFIGVMNFIGSDCFNCFKEGIREIEKEHSICLL